VLIAVVSAGPTGAAGEEPLRFRLEAAGAEVLAEPHDLALSPDGAALYVADNGNDRIAVLEPHSLAVLATFGEGELAAPHDVVFDAVGQLLVADTGNDRIAIYRIEGRAGTLAGELRGGIRRPEGVAVHPDGRVLATGAASGNLVAYRAGVAVAERGGLSAPHDVEIGPDGAIWVADSGNDRLLRYTAELAVDGVYSGTTYGFNGPRYLDFDGQGRLYVADKYANQVKVIDRNGRWVSTLGVPTAGKGEGRFDRPEGVESSGDQLWLADTYNDRVVRYRVSGSTGQ
jgi:DNA-binding beta-propeller fold protein YncE